MSDTQNISGSSSLGARHTPADDDTGADVSETSIVRGVILAGKYRLIAEIGRGGMGSVWRAERLGWQAPVAVKMMTRSGDHKPGARKRFEREARLAAGLRSPHVVQVLDHGVDEATDTPYLVMELLEGESLAVRLRRLGRLSVDQTLDLVTQLSRALTRAHREGIVHRDLKPDNVFLVSNDDDTLVKVLDFGVAKWIGPINLDSFETRPGSLVGSPMYMSPEQLQTQKGVDHRADLWSLAVIVCECLTGTRPFAAPNFASLAVMLCGGGPRPAPSDLGPVPLGFDQWFRRATSTQIEDRFDSAQIFTEALRQACGQRPSAAASLATPISSSGETLPLDPTALLAAQQAPPPGSHQPRLHDSLAPTLTAHDAKVTSRHWSRIGLGAVLGLVAAAAILLTLRQQPKPTSRVSRKLEKESMSQRTGTQALSPPVVRFVESPDYIVPAAPPEAIEPLEEPPTKTTERPQKRLRKKRQTIRSTSKRRSRSSSIKKKSKPQAAPELPQAPVRVNGHQIRTILKATSK